MNLFYTPNLQGNERYVILDKNESKHAIKVLHMKSNDKIYLTNGRAPYVSAQLLMMTLDAVKCKSLIQSKNIRKENAIYT